MTRKGYEDIAVAAPVTVPYVRHSTRGAHWFVGQALRALVEEARIDKAQIDGLAHRVALGFGAEPPDAHAFFAYVECAFLLIDCAEARILAGRNCPQELSGDAVSSREQFVLICEATVRRGEKIVTAG